MKITSTLTFDATPDQVVAALLSPELAAKRAALAKVDDYAHEVDGSKATTTVRVPAERLPSKVSKFARNGATATITTEAVGNVVNYSVDPHGVPVEVSASLDLQDEAGATKATLTAEFDVKIPLIGNTIEKKVAGRVDRLLAKDASLVSAVIKGE